MSDPHQSAHADVSESRLLPPGLAHKPEERKETVRSVLIDMEDRLNAKIRMLVEMGRNHPDMDETMRLDGKAEGVALALSFVKEMIRER